MSRLPQSDLLDILIVDDNQADRMLIKMAFLNAEAPLKLHLCASAMQALDFLYQRGDHLGAPRPHACLCDVRMPGMSGLELLAQIKSDAGLKAIPVIMFSNSDDENDISQAYAHHCNGYIQKPIHSEQMDDFARVLTKMWTNMLLLPESSAA